MKYFTDVRTLEELRRQNIEIEIVGAWLWISGNTYSYKKELKELGFKWTSQKKQWYFHTDAYRKKSLVLRL